MRRRSVEQCSVALLQLKRLAVGQHGTTNCPELPEVGEVASRAVQFWHTKHFES